MNDHLRSETATEDDAVDRAALELLLQSSHPWTESEITRALSVAGEVSAALARLNNDGLINRWSEFAAPSYAALCFLGINHDEDPCSAHEHRDERIVLELMLATTDASRPMARPEVLRELGSSRRKRNRIDDAISRLIAAGLLDTSEDMLFLSRAAARFDQLSL
jgi:hypothetical protein